MLVLSCATSLPFSGRGQDRIRHLHSTFTESWPLLRYRHSNAQLWYHQMTLLPGEGSAVTTSSGIHSASDEGDLSRKLSARHPLQRARGHLKQTIWRCWLLTGAGMTILRACRDADELLARRRRPLAPLTRRPPITPTPPGGGFTAPGPFCRRRLAPSTAGAAAA